MVHAKISKPEYKSGDSQAAKIAEYLIPHLIEDEMIFGENVQINISLASKYDDLFRGVDCYFRVFYNSETNNDASEIVGIDIKTNVEGNRSNEVVEDSYRKNVERLRSGNLPSVKFFIDPSNDLHLDVEVPVLKFVYLLKSNKVIQLAEILSVPKKDRSDLQEDILDNFTIDFCDNILSECWDTMKQLQQYRLLAAGSVKEKIEAVYKRYERFYSFFKKVKKDLQVEIDAKRKEKKEKM